MLELDQIVHEQAVAIKRLLAQVELRQSPSAYYDRLLRFLIDLCDRTEVEIRAVSELARRHGNGPDGRIQQASQQLVIFCSHVLREIHYYCESFDYAEQPTIPTAMMQLIKKMGNQIAHQKPFILRGAFQFNYMYNPIGKYLNSLASRISENADLLDDAFATFSFPMANNQNILANCALVHEFGHLVVDAARLLEKLSQDLPHEIRTSVTQIVDQHARAGNQLDFGVMQRTERANEVLVSWIHESLADLIGLHLLGPAHLFTFLYCIQPYGKHEADDEEHPCDSYRVKMMLDGLKGLDWQDVIRSEAPRAWEIAQSIRQMRREAGEYRYDAAAECMPILEPYLFDSARTICKNATYSKGLFVSGYQHMLELLKRGIPPLEVLDNSVFRQFDAVSILNSGWLFYAKDFPSWRERISYVDSTDQLDFLNRLLTKAIELSFVQEASSIVGDGG